MEKKWVDKICQEDSQKYVRLSLLGYNLNVFSDINQLILL